MIHNVKNYLLTIMLWKKNLFESFESND